MINIDQGTDGERTSKITKLDRLLHEYDSEYNYLFSVVKEGAASGGENELKTYYHFPNIARRLLEGFLAFKKPNLSYSLQKALDSIDFNIAKKNRIIRFLHTNSHNDLISEPEHDHSILIETPAVLNNVLELIKDVDEDHYEEMVKCVDKKL
jgi:wobble nucleotide-excising tRNase